MKDSAAVSPPISPPISYAAMVKKTSPGPSAPATLPLSPLPLSPPILSSPPSLSPLAPAFIASSFSTPTPSPPTLPCSPDDNTDANEPHWACPGRLAWLGSDMVGPSSVIRQRLGCQERVDGFENHPVLIWSAPDKDGIVKIIPITSYGGKRAEEKWRKMREGPQKWAKLQQLLMFESGLEQPHCGTDTLLFTKPLSCRKRSYLRIEDGIFNLEVDCLKPYSVRADSDIRLAESAMHYITMQLHRYVHPCLWVGEEDAYVQFQMACSAKDLMKQWRCS